MPPPAPSAISSSALITHGTFAHPRNPPLSAPAGRPRPLSLTMRTTWSFLALKATYTSLA